MSKGTLYAPVGFHKAQRILTIAKYSGKNVELNTEKVPSNLMVPLNACPVYTEGDCTLFEANAIGYYIGNDQTRGGKDSVITAQWCNYAELVLLPAVSTLVLPCLGHMQFNKSENDKARKLLDEQFSFINTHLSTRTYLATERVSQADITVYSVIKSVCELVYDEQSRRSLVHLSRWFLTIGNQDNVKSIFGEAKLCEVPAKFDAKKYSELHPSTKKVEKQDKKEPKKKQEKPKKEVEEEDEDDAPKEPKKTCPFSALNKGTFDMDTWKKMYSNNDVETVAVPYFWENFDSENYSIWEAEYLYPDELNLLFMTSNLVGGMFQRLDKMVKFAFGTVVIAGKDKDNVIKGLWIWRGQDLAFTLSEDCQCDYESYKWSKLDPSAQETKDKVLKYFTGKVDIDGKPVADFKVFK